MGHCNNCTWIQHECEVCKLLDNDNSIKEVTYCKPCGVYICRKHHNDWSARFRAAFLTAKDKLKALINPIVNTDILSENVIIENNEPETTEVIEPIIKKKSKKKVVIEEIEPETPIE